MKRERKREPDCGIVVNERVIRSCESKGALLYYTESKMYVHVDRRRIDRIELVAKTTTKAITKIRM